MTTKLVFAQKGCERPSFQKLIDSVKPFIKREVLIAGLALGIGAAPIIMSAPKAQDTSTHAVTNDTHKELSSELAKLPKVPLATMQKLDSATYRPTSDEPPVMNKQFETIAEALYPDKSDGIKVHANICQDSVGCMGGRLPDKSIAIAAGGKFIQVIDLAPFADLYKHATGKELKFVKLVATNGKDADIGTYAGVYVVPVDKPNGEIVGGIPVFLSVVPINSKKTYHDEVLIAMQ